MTSDHPLAGRVAMVTGASGGIGQAITRRLAEAGCHVGLTWASNRDAAERTAAHARELGVRSISVRADLRDPDGGLTAINEIENHLGPVRVLVANAGLGTRVTGLTDVDPGLWRRTIAVNLDAPFLQAQRLVPSMAADGYGRVLFTSSLAATTGGLVGPHYAASKAALHGLVAWLATRYAPDGVTVNAVAPALIEATAMLPDAAPPPVGRFGTPDDVADVALLMLSNAYITGKTWTLDGGLHPNT